MEPSRKEKWKERLDLNAPLISTRRSCTHASEKLEDDHGSGTGVDTSRRVPFLWEKAPGKPKDMEGLVTSSEFKEILGPPKLPPSRWRPDDDHGIDTNNDTMEFRYSGWVGQNFNKYEATYDVVSNNNNNNDDDDDDDNDNFSDAVETMSNCSLGGVSGLDGEDIKMGNGHSRSFIINRFLPAAKAMVASSPCHPIRRNLHEKTPSYPSKEQETKEVMYHRSTTIQLPLAIHEPEEDLGSCLPPKACGFIFFLPWRLKNVPCNPILHYFPKAKFKMQRSNVLCGSSSIIDGDDNPVFEETVDVEDGDGDGDGDGDESVATTEARPSIGWGVPFLGYKRVPCGKWSDLVASEKKVSRSEGESSCRSHCNGEEGGVSECKRVTARLPSLKSPTESWLPHALSSLNGKTRR